MLCRSRNTTSSSSSSSIGGGGAEHDPVAVNVNPFVPDTVNRMLNSLGGIPEGAVKEVVTDTGVTIVERGGLLGGGLIYDSVSPLAEGSFPTLYLAKRDKTFHVLKVS